MVQFPHSYVTTGKVKMKITQSCPTLWDPMDYTVHGIIQARILEWVAFPISRGSSQPRDWAQVSHIAGRFFTSWATREAKEYWSGQRIPSPEDLPNQDQTGVSCIASGFFTNWAIREALTTGKIIALIILTFVSKVMSLLFNMLSRFVIAFLPWWVRWWRVCLQCGRPGFNPWVRKISWRRKWQPTPVFLPGKSHGCRNLVGYSPWGRKESDMTEQLHFLSFFLSFQKVSNF